jgi:hypothetical protein
VAAHPGCSQRSRDWRTRPGWQRQCIPAGGNSAARQAQWRGRVHVPALGLVHDRAGGAARRHNLTEWVLYDFGKKIEALAVSVCEHVLDVFGLLDLWQIAELLEGREKTIEAGRPSDLTEGCNSICPE